MWRLFYTVNRQWLLIQVLYQSFMMSFFSSRRTSLTLEPWNRLLQKCPVEVLLLARRWRNELGVVLPPAAIAFQGSKFRSPVAAGANLVVGRRVRRCILFL
jgi:hypothetical protein